MKLTTKDYVHEISWTFGPCSSASQGIPYGNNDNYSEQCSLASKTFTLTCEDSYGDGWHGGYLEIQGIKYCEDFYDGKQKTVEVNLGK